MKIPYNYDDDEKERQSHDHITYGSRHPREGPSLMLHRITIIIGIALKKPSIRRVPRDTFVLTRTSMVVIAIPFSCRAETHVGACCEHTLAQTFQPLVGYWSSSRRRSDR